MWHYLKGFMNQQNFNSPFMVHYWLFSKFANLLQKVIPQTKVLPSFCRLLYINFF